ncbi:MAG: M28 family peptidase, partial [Bacteroidales bacterium]|nr:M28 family peptidase [Bacteroidales bacterium]
MTKRIFITIALLTVCYAGLFSQSAALLRMKRDVAVLAADSLKGREAGTVGEAKAARHIEREFLKADVTLLFPSPGQDFSIIAAEGDTLKSSNIIGVVEGWDPKLRDQYILIGAHYDHLGTTVIKINGRDSLMIFAGADDTASGVAVMLEVARMV